MPPTIQRPQAPRGCRAAPATAAGATKIPEPRMMPMKMATASASESCRRSVVLDAHVEPRVAKRCDGALDDGRERRLLVGGTGHVRARLLEEPANETVQPLGVAVEVAEEPLALLRRHVVAVLPEDLGGR